MEIREPAPAEANWTNAELNRYLNAALRSLGGVARIPAYSALEVNAETALVNLPADFAMPMGFRWNDAGDLRPYPKGLPPRGIAETGEPLYYLLEGVGQVRLVPVPAEAGTLHVAYFRYPAPMAQDTDRADLPEVGEVDLDDILVLGIVWRAKRKDIESQEWISYRNDFDLQKQAYAAARFTATNVPGQMRDLMGGSFELPKIMADALEGW